jgi:nucleoside-diphosphate-sugar epimerase
MRLLVTGGTGFVGSHLIAHLANRHELYAIARRAPPPEIADRATWIEQDLDRFDPAALPARVDGVIHLAQSSHYRDFPAGAPDVFSVNVASTFALLEYARKAGARSFVLASTGGLYGYRPHPIREDEDAPRPTTFYFRSKRSAELIADAYSEMLSVIVLRFFFVYGPGQTRMLIPTLIDKIARGEEIVVEGDPGLSINPIHVDDAVRVFEPALELGGSATFNVAGSERVTLSELVRLIGEIAGRSPAIVHTDAQPEGDLVADVARMRDVLGVAPQVPLSAGLGSAIATPSSRR